MIFCKSLLFLHLVFVSWSFLLKKWNSSGLCHYSTYFNKHRDGGTEENSTHNDFTSLRKLLSLCLAEQIENKLSLSHLKLSPPPSHCFKHHSFEALVVALQRRRTERTRANVWRLVTAKRISSGPRVRVGRALLPCGSISFLGQQLSRVRQGCF